MSLYRNGSLEVICGPMFSGKTTELIRRVNRARIARQRVQIFKPESDTRWYKEKVTNHDNHSIDAIPVAKSLDILDHLHDKTRIIVVDEVQFFDNEIVTLANKLANQGHRFICAGLDLDYRAKPFGPMPNLLSLADDIFKTSAVCTICGADAYRTQRIVSSDKSVLIGAQEAYEARCRAHFDYVHENDMSSLHSKRSKDSSHVTPSS